MPTKTAWSFRGGWNVGDPFRNTDLNNIASDFQSIGGNVLYNGFRADNIGGWTSATQPRAFTRLSVAQSIPNATWTVVAVDHDDITPQGISRPVSGQFTIPYTGLYQFSGVVAFASNSSGLRYLQWANISQGIQLSLVTNQQGVTGDATYLAAPPVKMSCLAGNTFALQALQTSGGALNLNATYTYIDIIQLA